MSSSTDDDKFPFFTEFAEDGRILSEGSKKYKRYTPEELEEACAAARAEALNSVESDKNRRVASASEELVARLLPALPFAIGLSDQLRREAGELALALARKIAGEALRQYPQEAIEACIQSCVEMLPKKAVITLKVAPDLADPIKAELGRLLPDLSGVNVAADPSAPPGAWSFEWETGGLSHNPDELSEQLAQMVEQYLVQPINPQGDLFSSVA